MNAKYKIGDTLKTLITIETLIGEVTEIGIKKGIHR